MLPIKTSLKTSLKRKYSSVDDAAEDADIASPQHKQAHFELNTDNRVEMEVEENDAEVEQKFQVSHSEQSDKSDCTYNSTELLQTQANNDSVNLTDSNPVYDSLQKDSEQPQLVSFCVFR